MKTISRCALAVALLTLGGCTVWPVNQDPDGMKYRREANQVVEAIQAYKDAKGIWPSSLSALTPGYIPALPDEPRMEYHAYDGSVLYHFIPQWPQLRPVYCQSVGATTEWRCREKVI